VIYILYGMQLNTLKNRFINSGDKCRFFNQKMMIDGHWFKKIYFLFFIKIMEYVKVHNIF